MSDFLPVFSYEDEEGQSACESKEEDEQPLQQNPPPPSASDQPAAQQTLQQEYDSENSSTSSQHHVAHEVDEKQGNGPSMHDRDQEGAHSKSAAPSRVEGGHRGRGRGRRAGSTPGRGTSSACSTKAASEPHAGVELRGDVEASVEGRVVEVNGVPKLLPGVYMEASLEARRRMAAFQAMLLLLEHGAAGEAELARRAAPLSGDELMQVAEERSLAGKCGNPRCDAPPLSARQQGKGKHRGKGAQHSGRRFMASADKVTVLEEGEEGHRFCGPACHAYMAAHAAMLGDPLQRLKANARNLMPSHAPRLGRPGSGNSREHADEATEVAAQVNGVTTMLANIREREQHDQSAEQQLAVAHARLGAAAAALGGNVGRAGAVEGYVPGTGRVGMAATAAAAAARKAAAAGESAYKAAAAAAAKSDTSESDKVGSRSKQGTAGGSDVHSSEHCEGNEGGVVSKEGAAGSSSSAHSSAEHDRLAEEGVRGTGAAVHGGAHMGKAAQGVKRVRFAEHNNFKYVYDVNAPCRPCPEHCVPVFQFTLAPDMEGRGSSKAAQKRAKASNSSSTIAMVGLLGAGEGGWTAAGQAGKEGALEAERAARLHAEQEAERVAAAQRLARERRGGGSKKDEKAERKAQKRLLKGKGKGKGKGKQGKNKKCVEEEDEAKERGDGGSEGEEVGAGEVAVTDAKSSEEVVEASGMAMQPALSNLCAEIPPPPPTQQQQQQWEQREQAQSKHEHMDEQQQQQQQQLQIEQERLLQSRPPFAEAKAQDEAILARIKQIMQERQRQQQQQQQQMEESQKKQQQQQQEEQQQQEQQEKEQQQQQQQQQGQEKEKEKEQQQQQQGQEKEKEKEKEQQQQQEQEKEKEKEQQQQQQQGQEKEQQQQQKEQQKQLNQEQQPPPPASPSRQEPPVRRFRPTSGLQQAAKRSSKVIMLEAPPRRTYSPTSKPPMSTDSPPPASSSFTPLTRAPQQAALSHYPRAAPLALRSQPQATKADTAPFHSTYSVSAAPCSPIVCQDPPPSGASGDPMQSSSCCSTSTSTNNALSSNSIAGAHSNTVDSSSSSSSSSPAAADSTGTLNRGRRRTQPLARVTPPHFAPPCIVEEEPFGDAPPAAAAKQNAGLQGGGGPLSAATCSRPHVVRLKSQEALKREEGMQKELAAVQALQKGAGSGSKLGSRNGGVEESSEEKSTDDEEQQQHPEQAEEEEEEEEEEWTDEDGEFGGAVHEPQWRGQGKQQQKSERSREERGVAGNDSSRECSDDEDSEDSEAGGLGPGLRFELSSSDEEEGLEKGGDDRDDVSEAHRAAAPFFGPPPKAFRVELSPFNFVWSLLSAWITRDTISYLASPTEPPTHPVARQRMISEQQQQQQQQQQEAGSEAKQQAEERALAMLAACKDDAEGSSKDEGASSQPALSTQGMQAHAALAARLEPHVHGILRTLHARVPVQEVSKRITHVLCTFVFPGPIPNLSNPQWQLMTLALLRALAMGRMPALAGAFEGPDAGTNLRAVLQGEAAGEESAFGLPHLSALVDLLLHA